MREVVRHALAQRLVVVVERNLLVRLEELGEFRISIRRLEAAASRHFEVTQLRLRRRFPIVSRPPGLSTMRDCWKVRTMSSMRQHPPAYRARSRCRSQPWPKIENRQPC